MDTLTLKINSKIKNIVASTTLAITAKAKELRANGCDVVNFAGGEPDFDTPDSIKAAAIKAMEQGFTKYTPSIGVEDLRKAIVNKFKNDNNLDYKLSQVAASCGAKHSIFNIVQVLTDEGDEVIIPGPYWVSYPEMVKLSGATPKFLLTDMGSNFKITAKQLSDAVTEKTKLLILSSPSNPTGMLYSKDELKEIADVCVKNNIYVVSDEIYEKLIYDGQEFTSIASLGKEIYDLTITVNGISKAYSMTGWRIGYCGGNEEVISFIKKFQDHSTSNPCSISQKAAIQALQEPKEVVDSMRNTFEQRRDLMASLIDKIPEVSYVKPQGAFYFFCDFSKFGKSSDVAKQVLENVNVAIIPGEGFGAPGFMRLSFATSAERIEEGIKRIGEWAKTHSK